MEAKLRHRRSIHSTHYTRICGTSVRVFVDNIEPGVMICTFFSPQVYGFGCQVGQWYFSPDSQICERPDRSIKLKVGQLAVHFFKALNLSRFFLNWASPYGDDKEIFVVEHDTVLNSFVNHRMCS